MRRVSEYPLSSHCLSGAIQLHPEAFEFRFIPPCRPIRARSVPAGDGWLHKVKLDGYRVQAHNVASRVIVLCRNGYDFTERFPSIAQLRYVLRRDGRDLRCRQVRPA